MTHKSGREMVAHAQTEAHGLNAGEAAAHLASGEVLAVDVREGDEFRAGHVPRAIHLPRGFLELQAEQKIPARDTPLLVYCGGGVRSALATVTLAEMGYTNVHHMLGGFSAWKEAGLDVQIDRQWTPQQLDRYSRHFVLPEVGPGGQQKISEGSVLVVGAGGLGSPSLYYLAAAGVGRLGVVDFDAVEENNLQRQIIHSTARLGENKAASAAQTIRELNPDVEVTTYEHRISPENVEDIVGAYDIVIDATDNFDSRYMLNQAAVDAGKPYVYGSIFRFEGYASVFWPAESGGCYRCLHPEAPPPELAPT